MAQKISGGCACGAIHYECNADAVVMLNCHCRDCQRASGSAYAAVVAINRQTPDVVLWLVRHNGIAGRPGWFHARLGLHQHAYSGLAGIAGPVALFREDRDSSPRSE